MRLLKGWIGCGIVEEGVEISEGEDEEAIYVGCRTSGSCLNTHLMDEHETAMCMCV